MRPHSWSGHRTVALRPCCSRTCAAPRPPRRLSGTRGGWGDGPLTSCGGRQAASLSTPLPGSHRRWEVYPAVGFRLWRREVPKCQSSPRGLTPFVHELRVPRPSGTVAPPSKSPRAARLPKWRRQGSSLTFSALSAALPTPLAEGMRKKGTGARSSGSGVGARIRSLPPPSAALPAAANVGFLVRLSLRYRTPAPGTSRPPG